MSTKTGLPPASRIEFPVAIKVCGVVITSSPCFIPAASIATISAAVPELTVIAYFVPINSANSASNAFTFGPFTYLPERRTSRTAFSSSGPAETFARFMRTSVIACIFANLSERKSSDNAKTLFSRA